MRYITGVATWLLISALWGGVGVLLGPGIVMLIIALIVGAVGSLVTVAQYLLGGRAGTLATGLPVALLGVALCGSFFANDGLERWAVLYLAVFIALLSFSVSLVLSCLDKSNRAHQ